MSEFPLSAIPPFLREAVKDVHKLTQAPIPLIVSSAISAMSLACQGLIEVRVNESVTSPVSLFLLVIANSGERKTSVDRKMLKPFYQRDADNLRQFRLKEKEHDVSQVIWREKQKGLLSQIRKAAVKGQCTRVLEQRLQALNDDIPVPPKNSRMIYNNVTPEALQSAMYNHSSDVGLIADEGANVLDRQVMKDLSFINSLWDGVSFHVERKTTKSFTIEEGNITLSVMVQKKVFDSYKNRQGEKARGSGFFARCLVVHIDESLSTQGERFIRPHYHDSYSLDVFHQRIVDLSEEYRANEGSGIKKQAFFEPAAQYEWDCIYNHIESLIRPDKAYGSMNDFASKLSNNVARLSALFACFIDGSTAIKKEYVESAWILCEWYMQQAMNLFGYEEGYYEALLLSWLHHKMETTGKRSLRFNSIRRFGPNVLRKGTLLETVMRNLEKAKVIEIDYGLYGARMVFRGRDFDDNTYTRNPVFSFYGAATAATVAGF
ncbi:YfjI family protein [Enterobacter ludwigii]|uniref:YfjI family protein n=1 Tax=Enterobacter ludwigii TaxID=299767 RepID=UPI003976267C